MADILISKFTTQIPRVGATPATPGFAESEGQDPVNPSGSPLVYTPVTIGSPANGLSIDGSQVLTIGLASTSTTGALSSTDWNTFNGKLNLTSPITGYTVGANTALAATDTILQAFGKVQGQINARVSGTIASGQVAFGTGVNTVGGDSGFTYSSANKTLIINTVEIGLGGGNISTNTRVGLAALSGNTTGSTNTAMGVFALSSNTIASNNTSFGSASLRHITSGSNNTAIGSNAGRFISTGANLTTSNDSVFIGNNTRANADNETNQIVIGNSTFGGGSNTTTIGNTLTISTRLPAGSLWINTTSGTNTLDVNGTARIRTISNLGTAATSVLVPSATGVVSLRTLAELASDMGAISLVTGDARYLRKDISDIKTGDLTFSNGSSLLWNTGAGIGNNTFRFNTALDAGFQLQQNGTTYLRTAFASILVNRTISIYTGDISTPSGTLVAFIENSGRIFHQRSNASNQSVRRDELYLNYSETVATAGTINNLAINASTKLLILTGADDLTGVVPVDNTRLLRIEARSASRIIRHESASSTAANRFSIGTDLTINAGEVYQFIYTDSRWRRVL